MKLTRKQEEVIEKFFLDFLRREFRRQSAASIDVVGLLRKAVEEQGDRLLPAGPDVIIAEAEAKRKKGRKR
jgi:hypothetical protein